MNSMTYPSGYEILGGADDLVVVVRLRNLRVLVAREGGALGKLAYNVAPETVSAMSLKKVRDKLIEGFGKEGADADVQVLSTAPIGGPPKAEFLTGAAIGGATVVGGFLLWKYALSNLVARVFSL